MLLAAAVLAAAPATAGQVAPAPVAPASPPPSPPPGVTGARLRLPGYLSADEVPDTFKVLPPAPSGSSPARAEDKAVYKQTRALQGSPRWTLAASDAVLNPFSILNAQSCALGVTLNANNAPTLVTLLTRSGRDASHIVNRAKDQFKQLRPFVAEGGPICTENARDSVAKSFSYPSGHATYAWAASLILAELAPDRAGPLMARARAFGESRVVCGVHWVSDVEEGRDNASILLAVLHANAQFSADLAEARLEVKAALASRPQGAPDPAASDLCRMQADAAARTPWTR